MAKADGFDETEKKDNDGVRREDGHVADAGEGGHQIDGSQQIGEDVRRSTGSGCRFEESTDGECERKDGDAVKQGTHEECDNAHHTRQEDFVE